MAIAASNIHGEDITFQQIGTQIVMPTLEIQAPFDLPARPEHFTGREAELDQIIAELQPGHVVTLCGPGGIGKTALAAEAIWRLSESGELRERFPDGVLFCSFYEQPQVDAALEYVSRSFPQEMQTSTPKEAARRMLNQKAALLILDGAEAATDLSQILDVRANCGVLMTSQRRCDAVGEWIDVRPLSEENAIELLQKWSQNHVEKKELASGICELVGHLPLAVRLAGRHIVESDLEAGEYLGWLRISPLGALDQGSRRAESVRILLERSVSKLSEEARTVLAVVSELAFAPFDRGTVAATLAIRANESLLRPLGQLVNYGLLMRNGQEYRAVHRLIHTYVRESLHISRESHLRLMKFFSAAFTELTEQDDTLQSYRPHAVELMIRGEKREFWQGMDLLIGPLEEYLARRGYYNEQLQVLHAQLIAYRAHGHLSGQQNALTHLGTTYRIIGQIGPSRELHQQALTVSQALGDRHGEQIALGNLGNVFLDLGNITEAAEYQEQALDISRELNDHSAEGGALNNLGSIYLLAGNAEKTAECCNAALTIAQEHGNRELAAQALGNLGYAYSALGQTERAIDYSSQALLIGRKIGHRRTEAMALGALGLLYYLSNKFDLAVTSLQQALAISREIGDRRNECSIRQNLGNTYISLGKPNQAREEYEKVLAISKDLRNRRQEAGTLIALSDLYREQKQFTDAIRCDLQALAISQELGDRKGEALDRGRLGTAYAHVGQLGQAAESFEAALALYRSLGDDYSAMKTLHILGRTYAQLKDFERAAVSHAAAIALSQGLGDKAEQARNLEGIGYAYAELEKMEQAIKAWEKSATVYHDIGDSWNEGSVRSQLGSAFMAVEKYQESLWQFETSLAIAHELNERKAQADILTSMGRLYYTLGNRHKAIECQMLAIKLFNQLDNPSDAA